MSNKMMRTLALAVACGTAAVVLAGPAAAAPASPGACNMLNVSPTGMAGMLKASDQGLSNMMELVIASEAAGCTP